MRSAKHNLYVEQGADFEDWFQVFDDDAALIPTDLTGCTGYVEIRVTAQAEAEVIATPVFAIRAPATDGLFSITMSRAVISGIVATGRTCSETTPYAWDAYITRTSTGKRTRVLNGIAIISPGK